MTQYGPGRPYPASSMMRARELFDAGWGPTKIRELMQQEGIPTPNMKTVQRWVMPAYSEAQLTAARVARSQARAETALFRLPGACSPSGLSAAYRAEFVATLTRAGVRRDDIEKVCGVVLGDARPAKSAHGRGRPSKHRDWDSATTARVLQVGLEMRKRKVPYSAICVALELCEGVGPMSPNTLRHWLVLHGAERDASRSRRTTMANIGQEPRA